MNPIQRIVSWFKIKASAPAPVVEQRIEPFVREKSELEYRAKLWQQIARDSAPRVPKHLRGTQNIQKIRKAIRWADADPSDRHDALPFLGRRVWAHKVFGRIGG